MFERKDWLDRQTQYPDRRRLLQDTASEDRSVYYVERAEGIIYEDGDAFSAESMNGLEARVEAAIGETEETIGKVESAVGSVKETVGAVKNTAEAALSTAQNALPLSGSKKMTGTLTLQSTQPQISFTAASGTANVRVVGGTTGGDMCYQLGATGKTHIFQNVNGSAASVVAGDYITSSSEKFKENLVAVSAAHVEAIKKIPVFEFARKGNGINCKEIGTSVEAISQVDSFFVVNDEAGEASGVSLNSILFAAVALIQQQQDEADEMKARLQELDTCIRTLKKGLMVK